MELPRPPAHRSRANPLGLIALLACGCTGTGDRDDTEPPGLLVVHDDLAAYGAEAVTLDPDGQTLGQVTWSSTPSVHPNAIAPAPGGWAVNNGWARQFLLVDEAGAVTVLWDDSDGALPTAGAAALDDAWLFLDGSDLRRVDASGAVVVGDVSSLELGAAALAADPDDGRVAVVGLYGDVGWWTEGGGLDVRDPVASFQVKAAIFADGGLVAVGERRVARWDEAADDWVTLRTFPSDFVAADFFLDDAGDVVASGYRTSDRLWAVVRLVADETTEPVWPIDADDWTDDDTIPSIEPRFADDD